MTNHGQATLAGQLHDEAFGLQATEAIQSGSLKYCSAGGCVVAMWQGHPAIASAPMNRQQAKCLLLWHRQPQCYIGS
jgi:hypothetical protein